MRFSKLVLLSACLSSLAACGGGGGGGGPPPPPPVTAPSNLAYSAFPTLTVGTAAPAVTPTVTGTVTTYIVSPALPAGLTLNGTSGAIGGTPTVPTANANYTVTASNSGGSTSTTVAIRVNAVAPAFGYTPTTLTFSDGTPVTPVTPASTGGAVVAWSVNPALPAGLTLDATTGAIGGTPTTVSARADYTVTALNTGGSVSQSLSIAVLNSTLLHLGHASGITRLQAVGNRILSDDGADWTLWNYSSGDIVVDGRIDDPLISPTGTNTHLAGNTVIIRAPAALESRDAATGALLATIPFGATRTWWNLATDGSYIVVGGNTGVAVFSRTGTAGFTRAGDYSNTVAYADPLVVRLANTPSGANTIELAEPFTASFVVGPTFQGNFHSWFDDGQRFLTNTGNTVRVYSAAGVQQDIVALPTIHGLRGVGTWFLVRADGFRAPLSVYRVGDGATVAASYATEGTTAPQVDGTFVGIESSSTVLKVLDLSGPVIAEADYTPPDTNRGTFAARDATHWFLAGARILDGITIAATPRHLGLGSVLDIAGSPTRIAVATVEGIRVYDAQTRTLERTIPVDAEMLSISADGNTLASLAGGTTAGDDRSIYIHSLASGNPVHVWPYVYGTFPWPTQIQLSANAAVLVQDRLVGPTSNDGDVLVAPALGGPSIYSQVGAGVVRISGDGTFLAITPPTAPFADNFVTNLYENGALRQAVTGRVVAWVTNDRVMTSRYHAVTSTGFFDYHFSEFHDRSGALAATRTFPAQPIDVQALSASEFYDRGRNRILSIDSAQVVWSSPNVAAQDNGAVAGSSVVFQSGRTVRIEPR